MTGFFNGCWSWKPGTRTERTRLPHTKSRGETRVVFSQVIHRSSMLSLENCFDPQQILDFDKRVKKFLEMMPRYNIRSNPRSTDSPWNWFTKKAA